MKKKLKVFSECVMCKHWSSSNKKFQGDGQDYCTIHYPREVDRKVGDRRDKKFRNEQEWFRRVKESNPI